MALANEDTLLWTHCCGLIVEDTNVSPFARARNIGCGHKFCVLNCKNVSQFAQHGNITFILSPVRSLTQET